MSSIALGRLLFVNVVSLFWALLSNPGAVGRKPQGVGRPQALHHARAALRINESLKITHISVSTAWLSYISTKTISYYVKSAWGLFPARVIDVMEHDGAWTGCISLWHPATRREASGLGLWDNVCFGSLEHKDLWVCNKKTS